MREISNEIFYEFIELIGYTFYLWISSIRCFFRCYVFIFNIIIVCLWYYYFGVIFK